MAGETLRLAANATMARLFDAPREAKLVVSELLSYEVDGADRADAFKSRRWDGRSSFFDFRLGTFPAGFVSIVARELTRRGWRLQTVQKPLPAPLGLADPDFANFDGRWSDKYDFQAETVRRVLRHGRIIAQVATGGGKSRIASMLVAAIRRPTLFLTTRAVLMHQMADNFAKAGFTPGMIGDGVWAPRKGVNVGMVQTLVARLAEDHPERERTRALLGYFEVVIGEEAHEAGGSSYSDILAHCTSAHYRMALTATPFMRPDAEANMRLMAAFGPIGIVVSEELLIGRGILATPTFKIIRTGAPPMLRRSTRWPTCYDLGVVENQERNRAIIRELHRAASHGLPAMALVQRKKHGAILEDGLRQAGLRAEFIFGEHENDTRRAALDRLARRETQILVGSTILDVGVDVPAVGMVALAGGGKAEVAHRQRIGRGLRAKTTSPNRCFVIDFADDGNRILHDHALTRRAIIEGTAGFAENLLPDGADFDYATFEESRPAA